MVRRRLSLPFTDVKEDDKVITDEEINNWKWKSYHEIDVKQNMGNGRYIHKIIQNNYTPPSHIQKPSAPQRLITKAFLSIQKTKQIMNLSCIAGFVICTANTTNIAMMMMMIQHLIRMRDIPQDMILTKVS